MRGMSKKRTRSEPASGAIAAEIASRLSAARSATANVASDSSASGSCQLGRLRAMSPPAMKVMSSCGLWSCNDLRVSTV